MPILDQIIAMFSMNSCLRSLLLQRYIVITMLMPPGIAGAQNLPSLLSGRNTNSTFAIVAYDKETQKWGIAVATNNIYVGNSTIYIEPGVGAAAVIAETEPAYGINALKELKLGYSPAQAANYTMQTDSMADYRQLGIVDKDGRTFGYTGHALTYWKGYAGHRTGAGYVVMGNQLADSVLASMAEGYEKTAGSFAQRLLSALSAGQAAGGQLSGKQSAALRIDGINTPWYNRIDLRVDNDADPVNSLQTLLNYHYGRIVINRSIGAIQRGDLNGGRQLLSQATILLKGWYGIYNKLAAACIMVGEEEKAIEIIQVALQHQEGWKENLSAFYYLAKYDSFRKLINESSFSVKDWAVAIQQELNMGKDAAALALAKQMVLKYPTSSNLQYLLAQAMLANGNRSEAEKALRRAIKIDPEYGDARRMLAKEFGK
jgi:uncharacterized Ntn-hydrolase superfamily protein